MFAMSEMYVLLLVLRGIVDLFNSIERLLVDLNVHRQM